MLELADSLEFEKAGRSRQRIELEKLPGAQHHRARRHRRCGRVRLGARCPRQLRELHACDRWRGGAWHNRGIEAPKLEEPDAEVLQLAIVELRERFRSSAPEAIVPIDPGIEMPGITFTVPQRGDKKALLDLSERNARYFLLDKRKQRSWWIPKPPPTVSWNN
jgi:excinuclease UvrABC nuclease subunit